MKTVTFLKEPGYTYDLLSMFSLYFNKEYYISQMTIYNKIAEDTEYYNRLLDEFGKIPEELRVFFYVHKGQTPMLMKKFFKPFTDRFVGEYNVQFLLEQLEDHDAVTDAVIQFYFSQLTDEPLETKMPLSKIDALIKQSTYEAELKTALYSFFISPDTVINMLYRELMKKEIWLSQYYEKHMRKVAELKTQFDYESLSANFSTVLEQQANLSEFEEVYVSHCLCNNNCVKVYYRNDSVIIFLGVHYKECMQVMMQRRRAVQLDLFGSAISEKNRVDILNFMRDRGEITIKDIEQEFGFTGTNSYYHLQMMIKAGMLSTRNKGRTVFYSINDQFFDVLCDVLKDYSKTERGEHV